MLVEALVYTVMVKRLSDKKYDNFLNYNLTPLDMYHPKFIVSNKKEESISIQRVKITMFIDQVFHVNTLKVN